MYTFRGWAVPTTADEKVGRAIVKAIRKAMRDLGILRVVTSPPQMLKGRDKNKKEDNMRIVKYVLKTNWQRLTDDDGSWKGPRGTIPFWHDQEIMKKYEFSQSTESSKYGLTWSPGKTDQDLKDLMGNDSIWITARFEYFILFAIETNPYTSAAEVEIINSIFKG